MPEALYAIGLAFILAVGAFLAFVRRQGDCETVLEVDKAHDFDLRLEGDSAVASCLIPLRNKGKQDGMVVELLCEAGHPGRVQGRPRIVPFAHLADAAEDDDWYWKALLLHRGETVTLKMGAAVTFRRRGPDQDLMTLLRGLPGLVLRVHCKTIGRRSITWRLSELVFPWEGLLRKAA